MKRRLTDSELAEIKRRRPGVRASLACEGMVLTAEEEALFTREGWRPVSLGPRILRAETAGIAAMAVVAAMFG